MKIYIIMKQTGDGCSWEMEDIEGVYLFEDKAEWDRIILEDNNKDKYTSFFIREYDVCEEDLL